MIYFTMKCIGQVVRIWNIKPENPISPNFDEDNYIAFLHSKRFNCSDITHYDEDFDKFVGNDLIPGLEGLVFYNDPDLCEGYLTEYSTEGLLFKLDNHTNANNMLNIGANLEERLLFIKVDPYTADAEEYALSKLEIGKQYNLALINGKWYQLINAINVN